MTDAQLKNKFKEIENTNAKIFEVLERLERKKAVETAKKPSFIKKGWDKLVYNATNSKELTVAGLAMGGAIIYQNYPDIQPVDVLNAVGLGGLGAYSGSNSKPQKVDNDKSEILG